MNSNNITKSRINRLILHNFRSYQYLNFTPQADNIVITGANGIGKTNILEAISLITPGRGFLNDKIENIDRMNSKGEKYRWKIEADISGNYGSNYIVTGRSINEDNSRRYVEINDINSPKQSELSKLISISWIIPQMDQIFISPSSVRRRLLDKIVNNFDFTHSKQLSIYEYNLRERNNLLKTSSYDQDWIKIIEHNMAQAAVIIATSRVQTLEMLQQVMDDLPYAFPKAIFTIDGLLENKVNKIPSLQVEKEFEELLIQNRSIDSISKRTNAGIHRSDMVVYSRKKGIKAELCSTGEQKSILISLFLAEVFAQIYWKKQVPVILLDDIVAHLDKTKRKLLSDIVLDIGAQVWITGTDQIMFNFITDDTEYLTIVDNKLKVYCNE